MKRLTDRFNRPPCARLPEFPRRRAGAGALLAGLVIALSIPVPVPSMMEAAEPGPAKEGAGEAVKAADLFARKNLWAWCIVPFDAAKRGPEDRAAMLEDLGIKGLAYDWRDEHVPTFGEEVDALRRHGGELTAFWCPINLDPASIPVVRTILDVLREKSCPAQLWVMMDTAQLEALPDDGTREARAAAALAWLAGEAKPIGSRVALYNHGGWFGEPENQIRIIRKFEQDFPDLKGQVGIVYNLHHGHEHLARFEAMLAAMKPHLLCLNLNGMRQGGPKILPIGQGDDDRALLDVILQSGYRGPIGILDHLPEEDSRKALEANLDGLDAVIRQLDAGKSDAR